MYQQHSLGIVPPVLNQFTWFRFFPLDRVDFFLIFHPESPMQFYQSMILKNGCQPIDFSYFQGL